MGKTEKGAIFLDPTITSPYEFFQYWRNIQDADIRRFLLMFTFLPVEEIDNITASDKNPNEAKERLAWEVTALIHGKDEADKALSGAKAAFGGMGGDKSDMPTMPTIILSLAKFREGYNIIDLFTDAGLTSSKSEARRLVQQGGAFVSGDGNDLIGLSATKSKLVAITDITVCIYVDRLDDEGALVLRAGKKQYRKVITQA
jgi:tyrosyl-tRNA synthetase